MTPNEFAEKIRSKYPGVYDSLDDKTLTEKVISKYPTYASQVTFEPAEPKSFGGFVENVGQDTKDLAVGLKDLAVGLGTQPIETGKNIIKAVPTMVKDAYKDYGVKDFVDNIAEGRPIDAVVEGNKQLFNQLYEKPVTSALDISAVVGGVAAAPKAAAKAAEAAKVAGKLAAPALESTAAKAADAGAALKRAGVSSFIDAKTPFLERAGVRGLDELSDFLIEPKASLGQKPIIDVTPTSPFQTTSAAFQKAEKVKHALGKDIGNIIDILDNSNVKFESLASVYDNIIKEIDNIKTNTPNTGKATIAKYEGLANEVKQLGEATGWETTFKKAHELEKAWGDMAYKHGSPVESKAAIADARRFLSKAIDDAVDTFPQEIKDLAYTAADSDFVGSIGSGWKKANKGYRLAAEATEQLSTAAAKGLFLKNLFSNARLATGALGFGVGGPLGALASFGLQPEMAAKIGYWLENKLKKASKLGDDFGTSGTGAPKPPTPPPAPGILSKEDIAKDYVRKQTDPSYASKQADINPTKPAENPSASVAKTAPQTISPDIEQRVVKGFQALHDDGTLRIMANHIDEAGNLDPTIEAVLNAKNKNFIQLNNDLIPNMIEEPTKIPGFAGKLPNEATNLIPDNIQQQIQNFKEEGKLLDAERLERMYQAGVDTSELKVLPYKEPPKRRSRLPKNPFSPRNIERLPNNLDKFGTNPGLKPAVGPDTKIYEPLFVEKEPFSNTYSKMDNIASKFPAGSEEAKFLEIASETGGSLQEIANIMKISKRKAQTIQDRIRNVSNSLKVTPDNARQVFDALFPSLKKFISE